jgi:hypothetical protein
VIHHPFRGLDHYSDGSRLLFLPPPSAPPVLDGAQGGQGRQEPLPERLLAPKGSLDATDHRQTIPGAEGPLFGKPRWAALLHGTDHPEALAT